MSLDHKQKRYVKRNINTTTLNQIAQNLKITEEEVAAYIKERWGEGRYEKFTQKDKNSSGNFPTQPLKTFNFKQFFRANFLSFIFFAFLVFVTYINSLNNGFVSDDVAAILDNKNIGNLNLALSQPLSAIRSIIYYFAYRIGGFNPLFYRLPNLFLHLGSVFLIYIIIYFLTSKLSLAFFTASIFAVHPILIESVTWISGGIYSQYSFFLLFSFLFYLLAYQNKKFYLPSLIFFVMALGTSEKAIVFPIIVFLYELFFSNIKKRWKSWLPILVIGLGFVLLNVLKIGQRVASIEAQSYLPVEGARSGIIDLILIAIVQIPVAISYYLKLLLWPADLTLYHSELSFVLANHIFSSIILIALIGSIIYFYKKNRLISFWLSFFIISLLPTLTPLGISWVVAERYIYFGSVAIIYIFAYLLSKLTENKRFEALGYLIFVIVIIGLTTRTIIRNIDWKNEDNLWIATGKNSPSDQKTHNNLGDTYSRHGDYPKAIEEFETAIRINPNYADAYHNLANVYILSGRTDEAFINYQKAAKLNPNLWQSFQNLAAIYFDKKNYPLAKENMLRALKLNSQDPVLYLNAAIMYLGMGEKQNAKNMILKALEIDPGNKQAEEMLKKNFPNLQ